MVLCVKNKKYEWKWVFKKMIFTEEDRAILIDIIANEQIYMIIKDHTKYDSERYKRLEELKVKVKDYR